MLQTNEQIREPSLCQRCCFVLTTPVGGGPILYARVKSRNRALGASATTRHLAMKYEDIISKDANAFFFILRRESLNNTEKEI